MAKAKKPMPVLVPCPVCRKKPTVYAYEAWDGEAEVCCEDETHEVWLCGNSERTVVNRWNKAFGAR